MVDWNDLRFFLETVKAGSYIEAARRLGVDRTTVARRINSLEKQLDSTLFEQSATGYKPTVIGGYVLKSANEIDRIMKTCLEETKKHENEAVGRLRIAISSEIGFDSINSVYLAQKNLRRVVFDTDIVSRPTEYLKQRKADVALVIADEVEPGFEKIQIGMLTASLYGVSGLPYSDVYYSESCKNWVGWTENVSESSLSKAIDSNIGDGEQVVARYSSYEYIKKAVSLGIGVSVLFDTSISSVDQIKKISGRINSDSFGLYLLYLSSVPLGSTSQEAIEVLTNQLILHFKGRDGVVC